MSYVSLNNVTEKHGSKAMNLSYLIQHGFNVPKGFALDSDFTIRIINNEYELDDEDNKVLQSLYNEFDSSIAVRSSGLLEDLTNESFAGQYDTVLDINTYEAFTAAVIKCIKSSFSEHANKYSKNQVGMDTQPISLIVQEMIQGDISGVMFTANPITGHREEIMITSALNYGFGVVDGTSELEEVIINKSGNISRKSDIDQKSIQSLLSRSVLLTDELCHQLKTLGLSIAKAMKSPQDIEWVIKDDHIYLLQTRSITTLYPIEAEHLNRDKLHLYLCYNTMIQGITMPYTPLGYEFWRCTFAGYSSIYYNNKDKDLNPHWIRYINGRIYYDLTEILGRRFLGPKSLAGFDAKDPEGGNLLKELFELHKGKFRKQGGSFKLTYGIVRWGLSLSKYGKISKSNIEVALKEAKQLGDDYVDLIKNKISKITNIDDGIKLFENTSEELLTNAFKQVMYISYGLKAMEKWEKWFKKHYENLDLTPLKLALPNNPTTEMGLGIMKAAMALQAPKLDDPLIQNLIEKYGHRSHVDTDLGVERWYEDPEKIIQMVNHYIENDNQAYDTHLKQVDAGNNLLDKLCEIIKKDFTKKKADKFKFDMENYRTLVGLREMPKFISVKIMSLLREMLLSFGETYVEKGYLLEKKDVSFLLLEELKNIESVDAKSLVKSRKEAYYEQVKYQRIPRIILSTGEVFYHSGLNAEGDLKGVPLSAGKVTGTVRILQSPFEKTIGSDDILVTHNTDPTWTPLFPTIKGLIMESGGPISHGAIVAREYGLPAVGGVSNALEQLKDGDIVEIDGMTGSIKRLSQ